MTREEQQQRDAEVRDQVLNTTMAQLRAVLRKFGGDVATETFTDSNVTLHLRIGEPLAKHWPQAMADIHRGMARLKFGADISKLFYLSPADALVYQWRLILLCPPAMQAKVIQLTASSITAAVAESTRVDEFPLVGGSTYSKYETKGVHKSGSGERLVAAIVTGGKIR